VGLKSSVGIGIDETNDETTLEELVILQPLKTRKKIGK
jgi:hypothetical protein